MSDKRTVFVVGGTGSQGGAVANALLERGHKVIALTRNPNTPAAGRLAERGARVAAGDAADPDSVVRAARGADAAYVMTTPFETGVAAETQQGLALV